MDKLITRKTVFREDKIWITATTMLVADKFYHAIYLHLNKKDFPQLVYPKIIEHDGRRYFDYRNSSFSMMDVHSYLSFYEETTVQPIDIMSVKTGWDFSHLGDEYFSTRDFGEEIIQQYAPKIRSEFLSLLGSKFEFTG